MIKKALCVVLCILTAVFSAAGVFCASAEDINPDECEHKWKIFLPKAASCTEDGATGGIYCEKCGYVKKENEVIPATGHNYIDVVFNPSCTKEGYTSHTCDRCGDSYNSDYTPKTPHYCESWATTEESTCVKQGYRTGECYFCRETVTETLPLKEHAYDMAEIKPSCTENGQRIYTCKECGYSYTEDTSPAAGHTETEERKENYTESDCKTEGGYDLVTVCKVCGQTLKSEHITLPKTEHVYFTASFPPECDVDGYEIYTCENCDDSFTRITGKKLGHDYETVTVLKATTDADGTKQTECTRCGKIKDKTVIRKASKITLSKDSYTYDGKTKKPSVTVKDSKRNIISKSNYSVKYSDSKSKKPGIYKVTISFKGDYTGKKELFYNIFPGEVKGLKVIYLKSAGKTKIKHKKTPYVTGYQIYYSTTKNGKYKKLASTKDMEYYTTRFKKGKTYYVKIRAYKKQNGVVLYGKFTSAVKYKR